MEENSNILWPEYGAGFAPKAEGLNGRLPKSHY